MFVETTVPFNGTFSDSIKLYGIILPFAPYPGYFKGTPYLGGVRAEHAFSRISWTALTLEVGKSPTEVPPGRRRALRCACHTGVWHPPLVWFKIPLEITKSDLGGADQLIDHRCQ